MSFDFCGCGNLEGRPDKQLLRAGWWPSSVIRPKTCATFAVLRHFHLQTLQGKTAAYDFYRALELETNNCGLYPFPVRAAIHQLCAC